MLAARRARLRRGALAGPPLALPARSPAVRRIRCGEQLPLVAAGQVLAPPLPSPESFLIVS